MYVRDRTLVLGLHMSVTIKINLEIGATNGLYVCKKTSGES